MSDKDFEAWETWLENLEIIADAMKVGFYTTIGCFVLFIVLGIISECV